MEIYWLGASCFRLKGRDATVLTDPCPPTTGYRIGKIPADIVAVSEDAPETTFMQAAQGEPKVLTGPGEYEIAGVLISGVRTDAAKDTLPRNIAYVFDIDDVRICHLGNIRTTPTADEVEALSCDVLLIPVGGGNVLQAEQAAATVSLLEPKVVIPMQYKTDASTGDLAPVERFLKEMGVEAKTPESRFAVTKSNVPSDTTVVLLNYRG